VARVRFPRSKRSLAVVGAAIVVISAAVLVPQLVADKDSDLAAAKRSEAGKLAGSDLRERFLALSARHSNKCSLRAESLKAIAVNGRLQGSCCSPMGYTRYVSQVRGLRQYADVPEIPADPYDIAVSLAKRLLAYDKQLALTAGQQAVYDRAMRLSHEHGPCCCHCWRWTAFEGQAKYLITRRNFTAAQIADVWNLEDGCGGNARVQRVAGAGAGRQASTA
jgi:hypothetical protein